MHKQDSEFFEYFFVVVGYPGIFKITPYALWKGIAIEILNFIGVFSWTYVDVFIMGVSIALSSKFKEMTFRIEQYVRKDVYDIYLWKIVREDYCQMCLLTKLMDSKLSYLILLSSANNLYFILSQCFQSLRNANDSGLKLYFIYSFSFVIIRTVCVYLIAASVNIESLKPLKALYTVQSHMYNLEVKRLIRFIALDSVCITGKNFFNIKRHILLDLASALVTYELVIVQFTKEEYF
ncbi:gustatory receptor for sugar taste 64a-like [Agrilus planipennis]|uniref:Gustatory receptor for sugar taste 64a-like n=1 Tax=Agrilus planipennis TaxID=224129 RepID=A0A1W4XRY6_AGRPL|nr:gustatory receptor for sugar taste 64a-like [Agrilus planipennis]